MSTWVRSMRLIFSCQCCRRSCCSAPFLLSKLLLLMLGWSRCSLCTRRLQLSQSMSLMPSTLLFDLGPNIAHDIGDQNVVATLVVTILPSVSSTMFLLSFLWLLSMLMINSKLLTLSILSITCIRSMLSIGRTPKGAYSTRGRSWHLLETPFSEPLLRTLLKPLFYCKTHRRPPSQNLSENPFPRTLSRTFSEPFSERCVAVRPLRRAP